MTDEDLHRKITRDVTQTMDTKIDELRRLQREHEERQKAAAEAAEARQAQAAAERKMAQEKKLDALLELQSADAEIRNQRQVLYNRLLAALVALVTAAAGGGIYVGTRVPTDAQKKEDAAPVLEEVAREGDEIEERVGKAEKKIEKLKDVALEQQVQLSDSTEYLIKKIDAAHPSTAAAVERPGTLDDAKDKASAIKAKRKAEQRKAIEDDADPFADLD